MADATSAQAEASQLEARLEAKFGKEIADLKESLQASRRSNSVVRVYSCPREFVEGLLAPYGLIE